MSHDPVISSPYQIIIIITIIHSNVFNHRAFSSFYKYILQILWKCAFSNCIRVRTVPPGGRRTVRGLQPSEEPHGQLSGLVINCPPLQPKRCQAGLQCILGYARPLRLCLVQLLNWSQQSVVISAGLFSSSGVFPVFLSDEIRDVPAERRWRLVQPFSHSLSCFPGTPWTTHRGASLLLQLAAARQLL